MKKIIAVLCVLTLSGCACACMDGKKPMTEKQVVNHAGLSCQQAKVSGMECEACSATVSANLKKVNGVKDVAIDVPSGTVKIYTDKAHKIDASTVKKTVEFSGYTFQSLQDTCK